MPVQYPEDVTFIVTKAFDHNSSQITSTGQSDLISVNVGDKCKVLRVRDDDIMIKVEVIHAVNDNIVGIIPASCIDVTGLPFCVTKLFDATQSEAPASANLISVKAGDKGKILAFRASGSGWIKVAVIDPINGTRYGFIPFKAVDVGTVPFGQITFMTDTKLRAFTSSTAPAVAKHILAIALSTLITGLRDADLAKILKNNFHDRTKNVVDVVQRIINGVRTAPHGGQIWQVLGRSQFTFQDIANAGLNIFQHSIDAALGGIYLRIYVLPDGSVYHYVGMTRSFNHRRETWANHIKTGVRVNMKHLSIARQARKTYMIPICVLNENVAGNDQTFRLLVENLFVLLFKAYSPSLLLGHLRFDLDEPASDDAEDVTASVSASSSRFLMFAQAAQLLTQVCDTVVSPPSTSWPYPTMQGGYGLCISSPFLESSFAKLVWTRQIFPGQGTVFRRTAKRTYKYKDFCALLFAKRQRGQGPPLQIWYPNKAPVAPGQDDEVSLVFELTNGQPHPHAFARQPGVGCWSDYQESRTLAIRAEWRSISTGKWHSYYLQREHSKMVDVKVPGATVAYAQTIAIIRYLKQQEITNRPKWMPNYGIADIRDVTFDFKSQQLRVHEVAEETNNKVPMATRRSRADISNDLVQAGVERDTIGAPFGYRVRSTNRYNARTRKFCDAHALYRSGYGKCTQQPNTQDCVHAWRHGLPTTWTNSDFFYDNPTSYSKDTAKNARAQSIRAAVGFSPIDPVAVVIMDPELMQGATVEGGESEEDE